MLRLLARLPTRTTAVAGRALQRRNMAGSTWEYALKHGHHPVRSRDSRTRFLFLSLPAPALVSSLRPARCSQPPLSAPRNAASFSFNTCARLRSRTPSHYHPIAPPPTHTHIPYRKSRPVSSSSPRSSLGSASCSGASVSRTRSTASTRRTRVRCKECVCC